MSGDLLDWHHFSSTNTQGDVDYTTCPGGGIVKYPPRKYWSHSSRYFSLRRPPPTSSQQMNSHCVRHISGPEHWLSQQTERPPLSTSVLALLPENSLVVSRAKIYLFCVQCSASGIPNSHPAQKRDPSQRGGGSSAARGIIFRVRTIPIERNCPHE